MRIGAIILNWNGKEDTIKCLDSLADCDYDELCLLVVDNGSTDGSVNTITQWCMEQGWQARLLDETEVDRVEQEQHTVFGQMELFILRLGGNLGYAGGNNVGIKWLLRNGADAVFMLNNDTLVPSDTIRVMTDTLQQRKDVGIVGCRVLSYGEENTLYQGGNRSYWLGVHNLRRFKGSPKGTVEVNFVPGCAMLVRRSVLIEIGALREDYFLYTEDTEFCHRAVRAGWNIVANLDATIQAKVGSSSGGRGSSIYYYFITRNTLSFIIDELNGAQRAVALLFFLSARFLQLVVWLAAKRGDRVEAVARGFIDFLKGIRGQGWASQYLSSAAQPSRRSSEPRSPDPN